MRRGHLLVSIGADQEQAAEIGLRQQMIQKCERSWIQPLQIVEKQEQRLRLAREDGDELPQDGEAAMLCLSWGELGQLRLRPDQELELSNQLDEYLTVLTDGLQDRRSPDRYLSVRPG